MTKATQYARTSALPAIAAALALSSTTSLAQQTQPTPAEPTTTTTVPVTAAPSTPAPDEASPAAQPSSSAPDTSSPDIAAPATAAKAAAAAKIRQSRTATKKAASGAKPAAPVVTHKSRSASAAKSSEPSVSNAPAAAPPAVQTTAKPAAKSQMPVKASNGPNDTALEIGGGALAILALGGAAFAIARRRRSKDEDEWHEEQTYEEPHAEPVAVAAEPIEAAAMPRHDPVAEDQSAIAAPSAFSWGDSKRAASASDDGSDRRPGETWVERAYRGPSPANPSVSLRNRLRRAAFFDKRERDVAEGTAVPVEAGAGLPDGRSEERELV